ncbi:S-adenosyl-L-methionine-dependent methyltransferase [Rhizophagus clarus]|uniref:S-adenosyl-L-methionine-dependent methyltransferase n=1 Tax=Rhizophagus clarus TaxID=94130 RepID=A0A8H3LZD2_9GLOM|nr:S-adenosyl-L-methionine-dependent methyltransferase [Rhizophagus clarus]
MGNNNSSLSHKNIKTELDKEIDNKTTDLEEEKELKLKYVIPKSDEAIDITHTFHFFQRYLFQSNFSSPIKERLTQEKCKVLDIGCGPGTWLLELANQYENTLFYGIENNLIYPNEVSTHAQFQEL